MDRRRFIKILGLSSFALGLVKKFEEEEIKQHLPKKYLLGYKGKAKLESGFIYAPYVPVEFRG